VTTAVADAMEIGRLVSLNPTQPTFYPVSLSREVLYGQIQERRPTEPVTAGSNSNTVPNATYEPGSGY
jgi:hypothetical protein